MSEYVTKSSGEQQKFEGGARRDKSSGKTRPDLISEKARLRWGNLMARGAEHYGPNNWKLGMPLTRFLESAHRHLLNYELGDRQEDHLAAVLFNIGAMIHFEGTEWDDINRVPRVALTEVVVRDELLDDTSEARSRAVNTLFGLSEEYAQTFQPELQPADGSMINWDKLRKDVEAGKIDGNTVNWSPGQAPQA